MITRSGHHSVLAIPATMIVSNVIADVERHRGRVVHLEYTGGGSGVDTTVFVVGKGITYDTGGSDVKVGGAMAGMHRDKCGAAAAAGLVLTTARLAPPALRLVVHLGLVRNGGGANAYVADEIITSRSGKRVRVTNTDAEGRMVMADLLCLAKEQVCVTLLKYHKYSFRINPIGNS